MEQLLGLAQPYIDMGRDVAVEWITKPESYAQFALLVGAYFLAVVITRIVRPRIARVLTPRAEDLSLLSKIRRFVLMFLPLLLPLIAYAATGAGEAIVRSMFEGAGDVIAFGKRIFIFIAVRALFRDIIDDPFLRTLGKFAITPMAILYVFNLLEPATAYLGETRVELGDIRFSALAILRGVIVGSFLFWLGRWSSDTGTTYIRAQDGMRAPTRELAAKAFEMLVYGIVFLLIINVVGMDLSALAIFGGAIGVGLGFGLQKIASNFISGIILLLEGQITVGDFVELDGGESGTIVKLGARATIMETFDGKWIMVPNEDFITSRVVNWSDAGSGNRYEVNFTVSYDADVNAIPGIVEPAVSKHPAVLDEPEGPDCELDSFGENGVEFVLEFWVNGIDDGKNKYCSEVRFLVWNALRDAGIAMPYPQREVRMHGGAAPLLTS